MIDPKHKLPVTRQAELLDLSHSSVYYLPRPVSDKDLQLMRLIDELHLEYPSSQEQGISYSRICCVVSVLTGPIQFRHYVR
jgi:hypothetical protein